MILLTTHYGLYIRILHSAADQAMTAALTSMDLTAAQGHILAFIIHRPQAPCARDIEEAFQLTHPTVSGILSRLEKKGFVEFRPDKNDRRCKRIFALAKGLEVHETMHQTILRTEAELVKDFTSQEQELFAGLLLRAIQNLDANPCKRKLKEVEKHND